MRESNTSAVAPGCAGPARPPLAPEEALDAVLERCERLQAEPVALERALGRTLAADVRCAVDLPPFASSLMDGYALRAGGTAEASPGRPVRLAVTGESRAGAPGPDPVAPGCAVAISTGAVLPPGADAVVPIERVRAVGRDLAPVAVEVDAPARRGAHVRIAGEHLRAGAVALPAGTVAGPAELGLLAACGVAEPLCHRRPAVAVVTTGDELVEPGDELGPGEIWDANGPLLAALAARAGADVVLSERVPDDPALTRAALGRALTADVTVVCGGVSVGRHDHVKQALAELGVQRVFWRVALRPGRQLWFGVFTGEGAVRLVFALPGKPASAFVTFELFVTRALHALEGRAAAAGRTGGALEIPVPPRPWPAARA